MSGRVEVADTEIADPVDVPLDETFLRSDPRAAPHEWDISGKRNVVADWPAGHSGGRSLVLNGHVDVVGPASERLWRTLPFAAVRDGDWLLDAVPAT